MCYFCLYSVTIPYTNKWYVNQDEQICQQDCLEDPASPACGGAVDSWNGLHDTAEDCCARKLYWLPSNACVQKSRGQAVTGSNKWYVDWVLEKVSSCFNSFIEYLEQILNSYMLFSAFAVCKGL
jgi:hypothetical protein